MRVAGLYVYPVKACRAVAIEDAALGPLGLEHDRRFAFIGEDGCALTQREHPLLATVQAALGKDSLRLDFGSLAQVNIPLKSFVTSIPVDVWGKRIAGRAAPASLVAPAADYLGTRLQLIALDAAEERSFADSRPVLVATTGMLARLDLPDVGMERFRPNVVLEGERDWTALEGKDVLLERDKPCGRCEVTTIDQASGARCGPEPLRTLTERFEGNFGVYCRVARGGRLRRGEILRAS
ncbi:MAG TPA: MOSC N-terminal beta barrel domain-containing protein [Burkholderiales bacterium]|jgi:hypothetical protein